MKNQVIIHVDMSIKYNQKGPSVIAGVIVDSKTNQKNGSEGCAILLGEPAKSILKKNYEFKQIHTVILYLLFCKFPNLKKAIVCADVNPLIDVFSLIISSFPEYEGKLKALPELREEMGDKNFRSQADAFARKVKNAYDKRKNVHRSRDFFNNGTILIIKSVEDMEKFNVSKLLKKIKNGEVG